MTSGRQIETCDYTLLRIVSLSLCADNKNPKHLMSDSLEQAISSDDLRAMIRVKISEGISDQSISELISLFVPAELGHELIKGIPRGLEM